MTTLRTIVSPAAAILTLFALGCSESAPPGGMDATSAQDATAVPLDTGTIGTPDAGQPQADSGTPNADAGTPNDDAASPNDTGVLPGTDAAVPSDAGQVMGTPELVPGVRVGFVEGAVAIGATFDTVRQTLGAGRRTAGMTNRSYEWTLSGGVNVTVWFANTNLDDNDAPPNDVDATDQVLWVAVSGTFAGRTPQGIGLGSTRAAVEAAFGAAPHVAPLTNPAGDLIGYYTRGILVAFDPGGPARTITISKVYGHEPDGTIDIAASRITFNNGTIQTGGILGGGTDESDIPPILGPPDSAGQVTISSIPFQLNNYAFIGLEVFLTNNGRTALFVSVHSPFYGTTGAGNAGLGSTRTDFEAYLSTISFHVPGTQSGTQPALTCYQLDSTHKVAATYSTDNPPRVTAILLGYPPSNGCP